MAIIAAIVTSLGACDGGGVVLLDPEGGTEDQNALTLTVTFKDSSGTQASQFGWDDGVPGATVTLLRVRDYEPIERHEGTTNAVGQVHFEPLTSGIQWLGAQARLSAVEAADLPDGASVPLLAGGTKVRVVGETETALQMGFARTGSVVISEIATNGPPPWETQGFYPGGTYFELHNNADTTVYMDGVLIGQFYPFYKDSSRFGHHGCAESEPMRVDPEGLWATYIMRFPGGGTDHPVAPGRTILIAVSATDHSSVHPELLDLREAEFEFRPSDVATADNPAAPDLEDVGPTRFTAVGRLVGTRNTWFVAKPMDLDGHPRMKDPAAVSSDMREYVRIPRERLLDATVIWWDNANAFTQTGASSICRDPVHPDFDAVPGGFLRGSSELTVSAQRRAVRTRSGRTVLLDTNVSAIDFIKIERTPGWIPEVESW